MVEGWINKSMVGWQLIYQPYLFATHPNLFSNHHLTCLPPTTTQVVSDLIYHVFKLPRHHQHQRKVKAQRPLTSSRWNPGPGGMIKLIENQYLSSGWPSLSWLSGHK
jgi:hypothetical protein